MSVVLLKGGLTLGFTCSRLKSPMQASMQPAACMPCAPAPCAVHLHVDKYASQLQACHLAVTWAPTTGSMARCSSFSGCPSGGRIKEHKLRRALCVRCSQPAGPDAPDAGCLLPARSTPCHVMQGCFMLWQALPRTIPQLSPPFHGAIWPHSGFDLPTHLPCCSWCGCNNSALFAELVPEEQRSTIFAFDRSFEVSSAGAQTGRAWHSVSCPQQP